MTYFSEIIKNKIDFRKINIALLIFVSALFGYYIYQTVFISSGGVSLVALKKEFLERKNSLSAASAQVQNRQNFDPDFIKDNLKMTEVERFDYIIIGPSEFALIENNIDRQ